VHCRNDYISEKEVESGLSPIVWFKLNLASRVIDDLVKQTGKLLGLKCDLP
jgi:hypothetical protein